VNQIPKLRDFDEAGYNPTFSDDLALGETSDPWPTLHELAKRGPVVEADFRAVLGMVPDMTEVDRRKFMVLGYDEVKQVLSDTDSFSQRHHRDGLSQTFGPFSLTVLDPPEHTRYRGDAAA
jgi:cytochrome P450